VRLRGREGRGSRALLSLSSDSSGMHVQEGCPDGGDKGTKETKEGTKETKEKNGQTKNPHKTSGQGAEGKQDKARQGKARPATGRSHARDSVKRRGMQMRLWHWRVGRAESL